MGTGRAFDATVRITDYAEARIGTSLGPRLFEEAVEAAAESRDAAETVIDPNTELQRCLVAILCAHAAVEAQMNEVGDALDSAWWATQERQAIERKWIALAQKRTGKEPAADGPNGRPPALHGPELGGALPRPQAAGRLVRRVRTARRGQGWDFAGPCLL